MEVQVHQTFKQIYKLKSNALRKVPPNTEVITKGGTILKAGLCIVLCCFLGQETLNFKFFLSVADLGVVQVVHSKPPKLK